MKTQSHNQSAKLIRLLDSYIYKCLLYSIIHRCMDDASYFKISFSNKYTVKDTTC